MICMLPQMARVSASARHWMLVCIITIVLVAIVTLSRWDILTAPRIWSDEGGMTLRCDHTASCSEVTRP